MPPGGAGRGSARHYFERSEAAIYTYAAPDAFYLPPDLYPLEYYCVGVGMRKGDPDALNLFNNWVDQRDKDGAG